MIHHENTQNYVYFDKKYKNTATQFEGELELQDNQNTHFTLKKLYKK